MAYDVAFQSRDAAVAETERIIREDVSSLQRKVEMLEDQLKNVRSQSLLEAKKVCWTRSGKRILLLWLSLYCGDMLLYI
jgi:hypothetical protein